jgi:hypothetical protein
MDMKRLAIGTIVGGITLYVVGYLIFEILVLDFYLTNVIAVASAYRDASLQWAQAIGNLGLGALVTLGVMSRPDTPTIAGGFLIGAVIGFLVWFGADFTLYSLTNVWTTTLLFVDSPLEAIHHGAAGAAIAAVLARVPKSSAMRPAE